MWSEFHGPNAGYIEEQYERFLADPQSVSAEMRELFARWQPPEPAAERQPPAAQRQPPDAERQPDSPRIDPAKAAAAAQLAQAVRSYGHWVARLDPLNSGPSDDPALRLETYDLTEDDLRSLPASIVGGPAAERSEDGTAWGAIRLLRQVYSGTVGHDYLQIRDPEERRWLREAAETRRFSVENAPIDPQALLDRLTTVEAFEHFLQRTFVAKTRFSIEGLDMLVPLLDQIISGAAESGIYNILIGMAHRGRLNVLAHILNKPYRQILAEFKDPLARRALQNEPTGWQGDVKYHAGASRKFDDGNPDTIDLTISMAPNPSHLEAVNPVVAGMARAAGTNSGRPGAAQFEPSVTLPVVIHGDASFPGQGVVAETLNMHQLHGYTTGGTIHIIANNQLGFTTDPDESRSTLFASDLAKGYRIPIIHANADDPEGVLMAARIAFAYRARFHKDFLIDLIGYRRLGHNEGDEPAYTQPVLYRSIQNHPSVRQIWGQRLVERGLTGGGEPERLYRAALDRLQAELDALDPEDALQEPIPALPPPGAARRVPTAVPVERLTRLNRELLRLPVGFTPHPRLARIRQRRDGLGEGDVASVDWPTAEELALASILEDGTPVRLTGQDVERGTFSHRHAVLHDVETGEQIIPLQLLQGAKAAFEVRNSPLSEYAALGFEFGYNVQAPERLVIWEAQYGDFINNAQGVVDEFLVSARDKWGQLPSMVLLLPHGYEGQGPDHSSGRMERFLNLSADNNLRLVVPTTAAQYFHILRRQAALLVVDPLPLVVMTPKSLLRHPLSVSPLSEFAEGGWQAVIPPAEGLERARRLILCSGKVYVDLVGSEQAKTSPEVAAARVEQLAPFPREAVQALLERAPALEEIMWVQEEPENMGAWEHARPWLEEIAGGKLRLRLAARPRSASPAEGSANLHAHNQRRLVERAYEPLKGKRSPKRGQPAQQNQI